jgi:BirA family biotin operon repressor/biotin-[acetyl-CoA-carboxylase] ligase
VAEQRSSIVPALVRLPVVDSTQRVAVALAEAGAADRTVVVADTQTAGRGRRGRAWHDEPGASVLASVVVRPRLSVGDLPKLSLAAAVAVADAIEGVAGVAARLKWPNDVIVGGRKIAGILLESRVAAADCLVVVGIGVNLRQAAFPPELATTATSVRLESGRLVERETMLAALLAAFDTWRATLETRGFAPVRARWLALADTIGRQVTIDGRSGVAVDLDLAGALVIRDSAGSIHRVVAGELGPDSGVDPEGPLDRVALRPSASDPD